MQLAVVQNGRVFELPEEFVELIYKSSLTIDHDADRRSEIISILFACKMGVNIANFDDMDADEVVQSTDMKDDLQMFIREATSGAGDIYLKTLGKELRCKWGLREN